MVFSLVSDWGLRTSHGARLREDVALLVSRSQRYSLVSDLRATVARGALLRVSLPDPVAWKQLPPPPPPVPVLPQPALRVVPLPVQSMLLSYLYKQYQDDEDLQAFVDAYNELAQAYLDWFNQVKLPIYTGLVGALLDWVGWGLYGYRRPVLPVGVLIDAGPYNSTPYNTIPFGEFRENVPAASSVSGFTVVGDDIYQRCLTWHFYKGDGKVFTISWLKRRVMRFLVGSYGSAPNIDQTYRVSVSIARGVVYIGILNVTAKFVRGAVYDRFAFGRQTFNGYVVQSTPLPPMPMAQTFKQCMDAGILETPFQFTFVVYIEG